MLYLVSTPIGNLEDMTIRAIKTLENSDIIACEDTRNTQKLLNYYEIKNKKLISYHEHNEEKTSDKIIDYLKEGLTVSLVSDAGMPCISDPGYILVKKCREEGIKPITIPGANAGLTALVSSGIESYTYTFYGFLPRKEKDLKEKLEIILSHKTTAIIYESPNRIKKLIQKIVEFDENREICLARELTKMFEQVETQKAKKILEMLEKNEIKEKGEFVVLIAPNKIEEKIDFNEDMIVYEINDLVAKGIKNSEAIKQVSKKYNINRREVYNLYHEKISHH